MSSLQGPMVPAAARAGQGARAAWSEWRSLRALGGASGRVLAGCMLALLTGVSLLPDPPLLGGLRMAAFDAYQALLPRTRASAPAIIVAVDEASLARHGQWPWPRSLLARLVQRIGEAGPAAIGLDVLMPEPDRLSPRQLLRSLDAVPPELAQRLNRLPDGDAALARVMRGLPVVVGMAGLEQDTVNPLPRTAPFHARGPDPLPQLRRFDAVLTSIAPIERAARGHGLISTDARNGVVRRVPLVASVGGAPTPAFSLELMRVALGATHYALQSNARGLQAVTIGALTVPTDHDGAVWLRFGPRDPARFVSAADVLAGSADPALFERKLVLLGVTGLGLRDYLSTPLGERMPGVEIQAQLLESLYDGNTLRRPAWMAGAERAILLVAGVLLIVAIPRQRVRRSVALYMFVMLALGAAGVVFYAGASLLFDAGLPASGLTAVFGILLGGTLAEADRQKRRLQRELQGEREAALRTAGELQAAWRIQLGMLPPRAGEGLGRSDLQLYAHLEPALLVGGDFYDYFLLDADRLFFCVGDVAGKGLPATLHMVVCKALLKSLALRHAPDLDLGELLRAADTEIERNNPDLLFVTLFAGVLSLSSGALVYCNAGHEAPYVLFAGGQAPHALRAGGSGPPLGVIEAFPYAQARGNLARGDTLLVYSDGVSEAMDANGELYGRPRLKELLQALPDREPRGVVDSIAGALRHYVGAAEQSDDFTLLALRRRRAECGDAS